MEKAKYVGRDFTIFSRRKIGGKKFHVSHFMKVDLAYFPAHFLILIFSLCKSTTKNDEGAVYIVSTWRWCNNHMCASPEHDGLV